MTEGYDDVDPGLVRGLREVRGRARTWVDPATGERWEYVAWGEGPTVVFLHGMAGGYDIWFRQLGALGERHRVVAVTYPPVRRLRPLADQLVRLVGEVADGTMAVVGSSLGGYVAQYLVAEYPERVRGAVFGNTFPPNDLVRSRNRWRVRLARVLPARALAASFRRTVEGAIVPAAGGSELVRAYLLEEGRITKRDFLARYECVVDPFEVAASVDVPTLILEARNDPLVPEPLRRAMASTYPGSEVIDLGDVGHFPYLNDADRYTRLISEFVAATG